MPQQTQVTASPYGEETAEQGTRSRESRRSKSKSKSKEDSPRRGMPWFVKFFLTLFLLFGSLVGGLAAGYSIVGKGSVTDVVDADTYRHMYNLVFKTS
jgi:hypothetical protein